MKRVLVGISVVVVILFVLAAGATFLMPSSYDVESSVVIAADSGKVFPYVNDLQKWQDWCPWTKEKYPQMAATYSGPQAGKDAHWSWTDENGDGSLIITTSDPKSGITYDLSFAGFPTSKGAVSMKEVEQGVEVTMRLKGDIPGFYLRLLGPLISGSMKSEFDGGLQKLKTVVEGS